MIPSFYNWIENLAAGGVSVSQPQHKKGEDSLPINKKVEKRIREMMGEFTSKGEANQQEILDAISYVMDKLRPQEAPQNQQPTDQTNLDQSQLNPNPEQPNQI